MAAYHETSVHHCEVVCDEAHGSITNWNNCKTNHGHKNFFTVDEFNEFGIKQLPLECQTEDYKSFLKNLIDRTVKIIVNYTSKNRPDTFPESSTPYPCIGQRGSDKFPRYGTGYLYLPFSFSIHKEEPCPCPNCQKSSQPKPEHWRFLVSTAAHVIFDPEESRAAVVELFYDGENKEGVKYLYGLDMWGHAKKRYDTDKSRMVCVTHDKDLAERLDDICDYYSYFLPFDKTNCRVLVSHPHGVSKRISVGKICQSCTVVKPGSKIIMEKGTRVSIPFINDKERKTPHCDNEDINNLPPHKKLKTSSKTMTEGNSEMIYRVRSDETVDCEDVNDLHKKLQTSSKTVTEGNQEMIKMAKSDETVASSLECEFDEFLQSTAETNVFELKVELEAFPPLESLIVCDWSEQKDWYTFPANTRYISWDGKNIVVSREIKFYKPFWNIHHPDLNNNFLTYDMATCPGSSGAIVFSSGFPYRSWYHFGCCRGKNQSGVDSFRNMCYYYSDDDKNNDDDDDEEEDDE